MRFRRQFLWFFLASCVVLALRLLASRGIRLSVIDDVLGVDDDEFISRNHPGQQDAATGAPAYAAGMYMTGRRPVNKSACRWYYGLPEVLSYPTSKLTFTPEIGEKSPYRVLPFILRGIADIESTDDGDEESLPEITLCTHATADQVYGIVELARRWEGPLSLAVFAPGLDAGLALALLDRACRCEPAMYKVSVHLIFPAGRPPAFGERINERSQGDCAASDLQLREVETERRKRSMTYPINVARNVARMLANTARVLVSDIELLPSEKLASGFVEMLHGRPLKLGVIFVLPVFEVDANEQPPSTKTELLRYIKAGLAVYFHRFICPHCQRFPGLTRWLVRPDPGKVRALIIAKREYPHHRWEPVYIGTREDPLYTEDMTWEGRQDKMTQMFEICLLNYRLVVLDGAFLVHTPGIKRKSTKVNAARQAFLRPQERRNARIYQSVIRRLLKQYPRNAKCSH